VQLYDVAAIPHKITAPGQDQWQFSDPSSKQPSFMVQKSDPIDGQEVAVSSEHLRVRLDGIAVRPLYAASHDICHTLLRAVSTFEMEGPLSVPIGYPARCRQGRLPISPPAQCACVRSAKFSHILVSK
jgi:hypothetical protein